VNRPRAADDFAAIRARMEELRREREAAHASEGDLQLDPLVRRGRTERWSPGEITTGPGRVRQSGSSTQPDRDRAAWARSEQTANQLGSLSEPPFLGRFQGLAGKFALDPLQHPRQRHGERDERFVQVGGGHFPITVALGVVNPHPYRPLPVLVSRQARIILCFSVTSISRGKCEPAHTSRKFSSSILSAVERCPGWRPQWVPAPTGPPAH
jgi:hypothetical protein